MLETGLRAVVEAERCTEVFVARGAVCLATVALTPAGLRATVERTAGLRVVVGRVATMDSLLKSNT